MLIIVHIYNKETRHIIHQIDFFRRRKGIAFRENSPIPSSPEITPSNVLHQEVLIG